MSESLFSTYWYRVANLKPALRDSVVISRQVYRGQTWYVLRNSLNGRNHRFNVAAYALIGQLDGQQTVQQLWDNAGRHSAETLPTQDEVIRLLGRLDQKWQREVGLETQPELELQVSLFDKIRCWATNECSQEIRCD